MVKTMLFIDQVAFGSMWYIPVILCLYTVLPLFALVLRKVSLRTLVLPALVVFVTLLVNDINGVLAVQEYGTQLSFALRASNVFSFYLLYALVGYWISQGGLQRLATVWVALGTILSFVGICALQMYMYSRPVDYLLDYDFTGHIICAGWLFELIRRGAHLIRALERPVSYLARISFAIYFIHIIIMTCLVWYAPSSSRQWLQILFLEAVSFGGSVVVIALLSRVPVLKKYALFIK